MAKLRELLTANELQKTNIIKVDSEKDVVDLTVKELQDLTYILLCEQEINASTEKKVSEISKAILFERANKS